MHIYCTARATGSDWAILAFLLPRGCRYPQPGHGPDACFRAPSLEGVREKARVDLGVRADLPCNVAVL